MLMARKLEVLLVAVEAANFALAVAPSLAVLSALGVDRNSKKKTKTLSSSEVSISCLLLCFQIQESWCV